MDGYAARPLVPLHVNHCELQNATPEMHLTSHDYQTAHTVRGVCVCLSLMQITRAFMFRELSDIWPGSEPKGRRRGRAVGEE